MRPIRIGVVGFGKIARDQHIPALAADPRYRLSAITAGAHPAPAGIPVFESFEHLLAAAPELDAVTLCTPPRDRHHLARRVIARGWHVMMEKPPGQTLSEVEDLVPMARSAGVALFAAWHSRAAPAVGPARDLLQGAVLRDVVVTWREDVRRWHPGQQWIWQPGGFGVFDPGINALSIVTQILPRPLYPTAAQLYFPDNRDTPIAALLSLTDRNGTPVRAQFDWREKGVETWDILVRTDAGSVHLSRGGAALSVDGKPVDLPPAAEYAALYARFADLVQHRGIDVDLAPLRLVIDALALGERCTVDAFMD